MAIKQSFTLIENDLRRDGNEHLAIIHANQILRKVTIPSHLHLHLLLHLISCNPQLLNNSVLYLNSYYHEFLEIQFHTSYHAPE